MNNADILNHIDIFAQLSGEDRRSIAGLMKEQNVCNGTILLRQGDAGNALYYLLFGQLTGTVTGVDGTEMPVTSYCQGQHFGEMGLLIGEKSPYTYRAAADTRLLVLEKDDFDSFLGQNIPAMVQMMKVIAQRKAERKQQPVTYVEQAAPPPSPAPQSPTVPPAPAPHPAPPVSEKVSLPEQESAPSSDSQLNVAGQTGIPSLPPDHGAEENTPLFNASGEAEEPPTPITDDSSHSEADEPSALPGSRTPAGYDDHISIEPDVPVAGGKVITIFSPKGGVGKSTFAVNLAVAMARSQRDNVALLDLSLTFGHAPLLLNLAPRSSLASANPDALRRLDLPENMDHYLALHPSSSLRVMAGAQKPEEGELVSAETVGIAIQQLRRHFAYLVIDTGSQFTDPVLAALEASEKILVICSPEMSVLRDIRECQRIWDNVVRIPRDRVFYVMNNIFPFKTLSREQLEDTLQKKLLAELPYGGDAVAKTALKGETLIETRSGSPLARSIQALASQLTAEGKRGEGNRDRKRGFFR